MTQDERVAVLFNTPWTHPADGWAIASRAYARCLKLAGVDVVMRDWQRPHAAYDLHPSVAEEMRDILADERQARLSLHIFSSALGSAAQMAVLDELHQNRISRGGEPQAFYCVFERRGVEVALAEKLRKLDGVMVQCRMNERVLREAGVENVTYIPFPFFDDDPDLQLDPPRREPRRFYNIGRFEPRKAPDNIIRAFLRAFRPGESELLIKTSPIPHNSPYPGPREVVREELGCDEVRENGWDADSAGRDILIVEGFQSAEDMLRIHADGDVYVTASRGEGLDLGAWAAKLSGRRIIATASGGPEDFLDPEVDIRIPAAGLVEADPSYQWGPGSTYIDYDLRDLIKAMQTARSQPACGTRTWPGWERHRAPRVAEELGEWVLALTK